MAANPVYDPKERDEFEAAMRAQQCADFKFYESRNLYVNMFTQAAWLGWQLRAAHGVQSTEGEQHG